MLHFSHHESITNYRPISGSHRVSNDGGNTIEKPTNLRSIDKVKFLITMSERFEKQGNVTEAIKSAETALLLRKAIMSSEEQNESITNEGDQLSEPIHKQALYLIQKCNSIAVGEFQQGRFDVALFLLGKALFLTSASADTNCFEQHDHDRLRLRAATLNNLGCLEKRRDNLQESLEYLQSAVEIETIVDPDTGASPSTNLNMCTLFNKIGKHDDAVVAAERAIKTLQFQAQQGIENIPQYVNMLMVAYYNLGVSIECTKRPGYISHAIDAYQLTLDTYVEHDNGLPSTTADAAAAALDRLRKMYRNDAVIVNTSVLIKRSALPHLSHSQSDTHTVDVRPKTVGGRTSRPPHRLPNVIGTSGNFSMRNGGVRFGDSSQNNYRTFTPRGQESRLYNKDGTINTPVSSVLAPLSSSSSVGERASSSADIIANASNLGAHASKHAARIQSKNMKKEAADARNTLMQRKAHRAHSRGRAALKRSEQEEEIKKRDELAAKLYKKMVESMRAEEIKRATQAVNLISALWRGYITREYHKVMIISTVKIQAVVRRFLATKLRRKMGEEAHRQKINAAILFKKNTAASTIQLYVRRFLRRLASIRKYKAKKLRQYHSAKIIQQGYRDYRHRVIEAINNEIMLEKLQLLAMQNMHNSAASRIQLMFRSYKNRCAIRIAHQMELGRIRAVTKIQSRFRGLLARQWFRQYKKYRRQEMLNSAASLKAICKIQCFMRVCLAKNAVKLRKQVLLLEKREKRRFNAARTIQCCFRTMKAKMITTPLLNNKRKRDRAAVTIKYAYLTHKAVEMVNYLRRLKMEFSAAKLIQNWYRQTCLTIKQREERRAIFQAKIWEREALKRTGAAMTIQTYLHSCIARKEFLKHANRYVSICQKAMLIQRTGQMYLAAKDLAILKRVTYLVDKQEKKFMKMYGAAIVIQRSTRMFLAKVKCENLRLQKASSIIIQSTWKGHCAKKIAAKLRKEKRMMLENNMAIKVQRATRKYLKRQELKRLEEYYGMKHHENLIRLRRQEAATMIQAQWKGYYTRVAVSQARDRHLHRTIQAIRIQRSFRTHRFRTNICKGVNMRIMIKKVRMKAAIVLQSFWRMILAKEYTYLVREKHIYRSMCAIIIQCLWRRHAAKKEAEARRIRCRYEEVQLVAQRERLIKAVDLIVKHARTKLDTDAFLKRKEAYLTLRVREMNRAKAARIHRAASRIQATYRGHYERVYVRGLRREQLLREKQEREIAMKYRKAAECIQRGQRCSVARRKANTLRTMKRIEVDEQRKEAEIRADPKDIVKRLFWQHEALIQTNITRDKEVRHKRRNDAADKIRSVVLMYLTRKRYIAEKCERERLATARRVQLEREAADAKAAKELRVRQIASAIQIQRIVRGFIIRVQCSQRNGVWANAPRSSEIAEADREDAGAIKIQSVWRTYAARKYADKLYIRKTLQKENHMFYVAARCIQKMYRGVLGRRIAKKTRREKAYRQLWAEPSELIVGNVHKTRKPYPNSGIAVFNENIYTQHDKAAICIQRVFRGFLERRTIKRTIGEKAYQNLWRKNKIIYRCNSKMSEHKSGNVPFSKNIKSQHVTDTKINVVKPPRPPSGCARQGANNVYQRRYDKSQSP